MYYGTPPIVTNGLVLNLDAANSLSIPVDPTVNQYLNPEFTSNTGSWTFGSWDGAIYTYQTVNAPGPDGRTIPMLKVTRISGSTGPAHFHQGNSGKYYSGSQYTISAFVSGSGSFTGRHQTFGTLGTYTLTNSWQRVNYTYTQSNNTQYPFWAADAIAVSESLYFTFAQSENLPYMSPYISGSGTSWGDLSGLNNTATLSSASITSSIPSYRSLNQRILNFDGTGSFANTNVDLGWGTGSSVTLEMWIKAAGTSSAAFLGTPAFEWQLKQGMGAGSTKNNNLVYVYWDTTGNHTNGPIITVVNYFDNNWKHLVLTWDSGSSTTSIYRNGELMTAQTSSNPAANRVATQTTRIGGSIYNWGAVDPYWSGSIQNFRVYNRALSQQEVTQNYNALKGRFGLQ